MSVLTSPGQTANTQIDEELQALRRGAADWAQLPVGAKIELLLACRAGVSREARRWTEAGAQAKGLTGTPLAGEESIGGPWAVLGALNQYVSTLRRVERGLPIIEGNRMRVRPGGQVVADVFPSDLYDSILLSGVRAEVWMQPGVTPENLADTMAVWYRQPAHAPRVALVLGAGNVSAIAPLDFLYKLVAEGAVCILKMNPVNDYLGPIFEDAFAPLVERDFLRFAYGGGDVGKYLCRHPLVDEIHITGSDKTHDAIVFGEGPDGAERKRLNEPLLVKPITSELGNVSPTIVIPGDWSEADLRFQAENVATQKLHNASFDCISVQVLILPADWKHTPAFVAAVEDVMRRIGDRPAYYPGAAQRCEDLSAGRDGIERFGRNGEGFVARTLVRADATNPSDPIFSKEAFASLLSIATLPGDTETYTRAAVAFANDGLWGTLGGNLIVHPKTMRDHAATFDAAVADLRFGTVGVNAWTGVGFLITQTPWGAYPGHTLNDIRSGIGVVHNTLLFSRSQKSVVYQPFAPFPRSLFGYGGALLPKPPWFVTHRNHAKIGDALCEFEVDKTPVRLAKIAALAMTG
jgi:aldehyde dehydrogenase (NAD(P)+)